MRASVVCVTVLGLAVVAGAPSGLGAQTVRDSAGIQIVENRAPLLPANRAWRVDARPILSIGDQDAPTAGDSLYEFSLVMGVVRMSDGRWAVGIQGANAIRFFDSTGVFAGSAGRRGQGPGEFQQILQLTWLRGDSLLVSDNGEVEYFDSQGKWVRQGAARGRTSGTFVYPMAASSDGSYIGFDWNDQVAREPIGGASSLPLVDVSADGSRRVTVAVLPARAAPPSGRGAVQAPVFTTRARVATGNGSIFYTFGKQYDVTEFNSRYRPVRIVRTSVAPDPVTTEAKTTFKAHVLSQNGEDGRPFPPAMRARLEQIVSQMTFSEHFPVISGLLADRAGYLWVRRYDYREELRQNGPVRILTSPVPTSWDVFDPSGRWLCTVQMPARFTALEIGQDYVAGLARDDDDVEIVRAYRLVKP